MLAFPKLPLFASTPLPGNDPGLPPTPHTLTPCLQFLRPHQREGVQFMFECVTGLRSFQGQGAAPAGRWGRGARAVWAAVAAQLAHL